MNNFSFVYTIIRQLCSNPTQCLVTIQKEKQTNHQFNSYTMLNYLLLQMLKTLSNIAIRNENLQTISQVTVVIRLVLLLSSFKILVVTQKLRERAIIWISRSYMTVVYGFQFTSPINKELRFSRDYHVKDYPEQHQFACHQLGIYRKTLSSRTHQSLN